MSTIRPVASSLFVKTVLCVATLLTVALSGCSKLEVKLGTRVEIAKLPVTAMDAHLQGDPGVAPGERTPLVVTFSEPDGTVLSTEGAGKGKVLWKDLSVSATLVSVSKKGAVSLRHDPRASDGKIGHLTITVPSHPGLHADLDVPVRYDYAFVARYGGSDGTAGMDGANGTDGSDGPNVQVMLRQRSQNPALLQASVTASGSRQRYYLVDPNGGSLTVSSVRGSGSPAGKAGRGGSGGSGGAGMPPGSNGSDGLAGRDGMAGSDGRPGRITVTYDPSAKPFLSALHVPAGATMQESSVP